MITKENILILSIPDRGSQYRSYALQEFLDKYGIIHSMSEPGTPVDNAVVESYHRSIKRELIYPNKHKTKAEMKVLIIDYLTDYYVNKRIHTKLNMTPRELKHPSRSNLTPCKENCCSSQEIFKIRG